MDRWSEERENYSGNNLAFLRRRPLRAASLRLCREVSFVVDVGTVIVGGGGFRRYFLRGLRRHQDQLAVDRQRVEVLYEAVSGLGRPDRSDLDEVRFAALGSFADGEDFVGGLFFARGHV